MEEGKFDKLYRYFKDSDYRFLCNCNKFGYYRWLSDEDYIKRKFKAKMGYELNLDNPRTYNEKLQWLKLHDRNPLYTRLVDKYLVKEYVAPIIGKEYIIPTLGVWDSFEEIVFAKLPDQFVLKCTHDSGGIAICMDKKTFDIGSAKNVINKSLKNNFYLVGREWPYKDVVPRIIAEAYLEDAVTKELRDYKIFVFDGKAKAMFIASDRQKVDEDTKFDFYDTAFNHLPFTNGHPNSNIPPLKPRHLDEMLALAEMLGKDMPHVRVDFYEVNGKVYFGEFTFYHWSGFTPFMPEKWDYTFGEWLYLPHL